jgi:hypothetical protein
VHNAVFKTLKAGDTFSIHLGFKGLNNELNILIGNTSQLRGFNTFGNERAL